ncbi:DUF4412 domain-containing protein [Opitutus sp. ER46]|uniref:DUF4412 domain-containing protein n=1 Tax=Opitutus sp. ER46 TaxID=2161864 RepID=UPI000D32101B|nr:DUF4412 domain-containing protein [Opitutus sp. ER46]PTY01067.1 hypothetical protein DB354_00590 [Opitutus sp. ER46]
MKNLRPLIAALLLLAPIAAVAAGFEGKIAMTMTNGREMKLPMTYYLKGGQARVEVQMEQMNTAMIINPAKHEAVILMPQQKMYMVQPIPQGTASNEIANTGDTTVEKTNIHEKICGYDTTKYIATSKGSVSEVWISDQLGLFLGTGSGAPGGGRGNGQQQAWEKVFQGKNAFPLRVVTKDRKGGEAFKLEATAVSKESVADSMFVPPADYQKFDMGGMMKGMMQGKMPGMPGAQQQD